MCRENCPICKVAVRKRFSGSVSNQRAVDIRSSGYGQPVMHFCYRTALTQMKPIALIQAELLELDGQAADKLNIG